MPIFYNKAARKNPSKPKEVAKWYPVLRPTGMLKEAIARAKFKDSEILIRKVIGGKNRGQQLYLYPKKKPLILPFNYHIK